MKKTYEGEPYLYRVMLRPKWILALLLALAVAAGFAGLAQWQMGSAVKLQETEIDSENVYPISELTEPQEGVSEESAGRMVLFEAALSETAPLIVGQRSNNSEVGYWVVARAYNDSTNENMAVALGWAKEKQGAEDFIASWGGADKTELVGRYMPQEGVEIPHPKTDPLSLDTLNVGEIINIWDEITHDVNVYAGFLVLEEAPNGLETIESHAPLPEEKINWLNLFYAIEWAVFGGFAIFFWYRLARDAWEKEHELQELQE